MWYKSKILQTLVFANIGLDLYNTLKPGWVLRCTFPKTLMKLVLFDHKVTQQTQASDGGTNHRGRPTANKNLNDAVILLFIGFLLQTFILVLQNELKL